VILASKASVYEMKNRRLFLFIMKLLISGNGRKINFSSGFVNGYALCLLMQIELFFGDFGTHTTQQFV